MSTNPINTNGMGGMDGLVAMIGDAIIDAMKSVAAEQANPNVVNMSMTKEVFDTQVAKLKNYDQMASDLAIAKQNEQAAQTTINTQRERIQELLDAKRAAEMETAAVKRQLSAVPPRQLQLQNSYNKLWKDYTACKNQRDSYAKTIAEQKTIIAERDQEIKELVATPSTPVPVLIIDSVSFTADDVRKMMVVSNERIDRINKLAAELEAAKKSAPVLTYRGEVISKECLDHWVELGKAAEEAGMTLSKLTTGNTMYAAEPSDTTHFLPSRTSHEGTVYEHRRLVNGSKDIILVQDPEHVRFRIQIAPSQTLDVDAALVPQMVDDIRCAKNRADRLELENKTRAETNQRQADSIRAAEVRIAELQESYNKRGKRISELESKLRSKDIEARLLRGRLNHNQSAPVTQQKAPVEAVVNGTPLESGKAYMTTALGMLPIDSNGMRQLSDALDAYRRKVQALTSGLQEWIKM